MVALADQMATAGGGFVAGDCLSQGCAQPAPPNVGGQGS